MFVCNSASILLQRAPFSWDTFSDLYLPKEIPLAIFALISTPHLEKNEGMRLWMPNYKNSGPQSQSITISV